MIKLVVGDKTGTQVAELEAEIGPVSWRLNDVGRVQFALSKKDAKAIQANYQYGNRVIVQFDNGLPNWVGVIDTPRDWGQAKVTANAYSGEYILGTRQTDRGRYFTNQTVGEIYRGLIDDANGVADMGITIGNVWEGGPGHYPEYHFKNLLQIVRESLCATLSDYDFDVTGELTGNKITMRANLYERKGYERVNVVLVEGTNLANVRLIEQGTIINSWDLAGAGDGWGDDNRIYSHAEDGGSISRFGDRKSVV